MIKVKFTNKIYYYAIIVLLLYDGVFTASVLPNGEAVNYIRLFVVLITTALVLLKISPAKNVVKIWGILFFIFGSCIVLFASLGLILLTEQTFADRIDRILMALANLIVGIIIFTGSNKFIYDPSIDGQQLNS